MAALGVPLVLLLGVCADLVAGLVRSGRPLRPATAFWSELTRAVSRAEPASVLEAAGGGATLLGAGLVAGAAMGALPGDAVLLVLALALAVAGAHLASIEPQTRPAAARARARVLESALVFAGAAAGILAIFLRWHATDLGSVWGAGEVLGVPVGVGPATAAVGQVVALLAVAAAAGLLVPLETEPPRGRYRRPAAAALLVRISRWAVGGAAAVLVPACSGGFDLTAGGDAPSFLLWGGVGLAGAGVVGVAWGALDRLGPELRLRVAVPGLLALSAAGAVLVSVA